MPKQCGTCYGDNTIEANAVAIEKRVIPGDYIILASDGLWDNMSDRQIIQKWKEIVKESDDKERNPLPLMEGEKCEGDELLLPFCRGLAHQAFEYSQDKTYVSPFTK